MIAAFGASNASAAASASESAPPEQATSTWSPGSAAVRLARTARLMAATAGCGPTPPSVHWTRVSRARVSRARVSRIGCWRGAVNTFQPQAGVQQLFLRRQRLGRRPDLVERGHTCLVDDRSYEPRTLLVLLHLQVDNEHAADSLLDPARGAAARAELGPDLRD